MTISMDAYDKTIIIESPTTTVTIQELVNAIRNWEDELINLSYEKVMEAAGKEELGAGVQVGITLKLINDWRVQFEDRPPPDYISCKIAGGNLVATNSYNNNPIKPSAYTQVTIAQSVSATIGEGSSASEIATAIWDEDITTHTNTGSFGEQVVKIKRWTGWLRSLL